MYDSWNKALASYVPGPKKDYWARVIHLLLSEGAQPLPADVAPEIEAALKGLRETCSSTDVCLEEAVEHAVHRGRHGFGWLVFENHDRSMPVESFIERVLPDRLRFDNYWLLPVFDDGEWISWTFIFVPMDAERALEGIEDIKQQILEANT